VAPEERACFEALRRWRNERARKDGKPAYVLFTNGQQLQIVRNWPNSHAALHAIDGIGEARVRDQAPDAPILVVQWERTLAAILDRSTPAAPPPHQRLTGFQARSIPGRVDRARVYYFSVGDDKHTMRLTPTSCTITPGKPEHADCVVKATPEVFVRLVVEGKQPGPLDIARGRFKTNDVGLLLQLRACFGL
jgi:long-chain acyl-CoA synthetase